MNQPIELNIRCMVSWVGEKLVTVLMKLYIKYLQHPPSLRCLTMCSNNPTDIMFIKYWQSAMHYAKHCGGGKDELAKLSHLFSPYIPNSTSALSTLTSYLSKPECCSSHIQLTHLVLVEMFSFFPSGKLKCPSEGFLHLCLTLTCGTYHSCPMRYLGTWPIPIPMRSLISFNAQAHSGLALYHVWCNVGAQ